MEEKLLDKAIRLYNDYIRYKYNNVKPCHCNDTAYVEFIEIHCIPSIRLHNNDVTLDLSLYFLDCLEVSDVMDLFKNFILTSI